MIWGLALILVLSFVGLFYFLWDCYRRQTEVWIMKKNEDGKWVYTLDRKEK